YVSLFGRDTLSTCWQAAILGPEMMKGTLLELARWQGTVDNPWRDDQPGKMLHEAHSGPLAQLRFNPRDRYYGAVTTSAFYPVVVSEFWHWTGNRDLVYPLLGPAMKALQWLRKYGDLNGDGFDDYLSRSPQGFWTAAWSKRLQTACSNPICLADGESELCPLTIPPTTHTVIIAAQSGRLSTALSPWGSCVTDYSSTCIR